MKSPNFKRNIMKNLIPTLVIYLLINSIIYSQSPFGTLGNKWTFEGWSEGSGWEPNWQGNCQGNTINYEISDVIEINGITCGIITTDKVNDSLIVYQENDEVYFYENNEFYKLYDFNAQVGDTIISFRPSNADNHSLKDFFGSEMEEFSSIDTIYTLITNLDTTTINGQNLKRWTTEPIYTDPLNSGPVRRYETIIENIGSLNGIVGDHDLFIGEGCYGGFVCYQSQGFQFGSYFFPLCDFTSAIKEVEVPNIKIYPNPTADNLTIELVKSTISRIEVYNFAGQKISESNDDEVSLKNFDSGIYFIKIIDENYNIVTKKVIKQ